MKGNFRKKNINWKKRNNASVINAINILRPVVFFTGMTRPSRIKFRFQRDALSRTDCLMHVKTLFTPAFCCQENFQLNTNRLKVNCAQLWHLPSCVAINTYLISAILVPPLPITHPISSFGTVISCCRWLLCWLCCCLLLPVRSCEPASAASAASGAIPKVERSKI